jgi:hypothetical protein
MTPYNASQMSFYERYWLGLVHLLPSQELLAKMAKARLALQEIEWQTRQSYYLPYFDPLKHILLMDWYNQAEYPCMQYFNSAPELAALIRHIDVPAVRKIMGQQNILRQKQIVGKWRELWERFGLTTGLTQNQSQEKGLSTTHD